MELRAVAFAVASVIVASVARAQSAAPVVVDVVAYEATLAVDVEAKTIRGEEQIALTLPNASARHLEFDAGALEIAKVTEGQQSLGFAKRGTRLHVELPESTDGRSERRITVLYQGAPRSGLSFVADPPQAFTSFSTSQWLVSVDAPAERATFRLRLQIPETWRSVGNGRFVGRTPLDRPGWVIDEWYESRPMPGYVFGFAVGRFNEARDQRDGVEIRALSTSLTEQQMLTLSADIDGMRAFFADRAGQPYELPTYTQVFAGNGAGQEMSGFALMPLSFANTRLAGERNALDAHELAHQWWGNGITCVDWRHFWLNEGLTSFMVAAWVEHRDGRDAYMAFVNAWRRRIDALQSAGHDRPLLFPDWNRPTADDRAVVYQKGAYVIHLLREQLGEDVFWRGIRRFSQRMGTSVESRDFQADFEAVSGRDLTPFFHEWVYGR